MPTPFHAPTRLRTRLQNLLATLAVLTLPVLALPMALAQSTVAPLDLETAMTPAEAASPDVQTAQRDLDAALRERDRVEADPTSLRVALLDARHAADAATEALRNARHAARANAASAFETVLEAELDVRIAEADLAIRRIEADATRIRQQAGAATQTDVARAEDAQASAERDLRDAQDAAELARDRLAVALGQEGDLPPLAGATDPPVLPSLEATLARLDENAPLAAARRAVTRSEANLDAVNVPFTTPQTQIDAARDAVANAETRANDLATSLSLTLQQAYNAVTAAAGRLDGARDALTTARDDLQVAQVRFDAGSIAELDVQRADLALLRAQANETRAVHALAAALRSLESTLLGATP